MDGRFVILDRLAISVQNLKINALVNESIANHHVNQFQRYCVCVKFHHVYSFFIV